MNSQPVLSREQLVNDFERAVRECAFPLATAANHHRVRELREQLIASLDSGAVELRLAEAQEIAMALQRKLGEAEKTNAMLADNWANTEQLLAKRFPEGYTLVPVTPTQAMLDAGGMMFPGSDPSYCNAGAQDIYGEMLAATPPSTTKESLTVGGEEDENADQEQCFYCKQWFPKPVGYHHAEEDCHPSAEPINAGAQEVSSSIGSSTRNQAELPAAPAPASGQAEAMREAAAKVCEELETDIESHRFYRGAGKRLADAIRALPLPPESETEGLLREAHDCIYALAHDGLGLTTFDMARLALRIKNHLSAKPAASEPASGAEEQLAWLLSALHDHEDVRDGSDGRQEPNEAMSLLVEFDAKFPGARK